MPARRLRRPSVRQTVPRPTHGPFRWRATADQPSRLQPSGNVSTAAWAGSKSNATGAKPERAAAGRHPPVPGLRRRTFEITQNGHFHLVQMANPVDGRQQSCSFDARGRRVRLTICESPVPYDSRSRDLAWAPGECPKRFWNCLAKFV
jgi:hypothetical protein